MPTDPYERVTGQFLQHEPEILRAEVKLVPLRADYHEKLDAAPRKRLDARWRPFTSLCSAIAQGCRAA
jgi:hypothetical protein